MLDDRQTALKKAQLITPEFIPITIMYITWLGFDLHFIILLLLGAELPLVVESFGILYDIFPFPSILDAGNPDFNLHLANILFDIILPSVLGYCVCFSCLNKITFSFCCCIGDKFTCSVKMINLFTT